MEKQEVLRSSFSAFIHMNSFSTNKSDPLTFNKHEYLKWKRVQFCPTCLFFSPKAFVIYVIDSEHCVSPRNIKILLFLFSYFNLGNCHESLTQHAVNEKLMVFNPSNFK